MGSSCWATPLLRDSPGPSNCKQVPTSINARAQQHSRVAHVCCACGQLPGSVLLLLPWDAPDTGTRKAVSCSSAVEKIAVWGN